MNDSGITVLPAGAAVFTREQAMADDYQWICRVGNPTHFDLARKIHNDLLADAGGVETGYAVWVAEDGKCMILIANMSTDRSDDMGRSISDTLYLEFDQESRLFVMSLAAVLDFGNFSKDAPAKKVLSKKDMIDELSSYCEALLKKDDKILPLKICMSSVPLQDSGEYYLKKGYWALPFTSTGRQETVSFFEKQKVATDAFFFVSTGRVHLNRIRSFYQEVHQDVSMPNGHNYVLVVSLSSTISEPVQIFPDTGKAYPKSGGDSIFSRARSRRFFLISGVLLLIVMSIIGLAFLFKRPLKPPTIKSWRIESVSNADAALFCVDDFIDFNQLLHKLTMSADPISRFLFTQLSESGRAKLTENRIQKADLVQEFNRMIHKPLYEKDRFKAVPFSEKTLQRLEMENQGEDLARFNRSLLEDVYPQEIARQTRIIFVTVFTRPMDTAKLPQLQYNQADIKQCDVTWNSKNPKELIIQISIFSKKRIDDLIATISIIDARDQYGLKMNPQKIISNSKDAR